MDVEQSAGYSILNPTSAGSRRPHRRHRTYPGAALPRVDRAARAHSFGTIECPSGRSFELPPAGSA
jgi:hypothetical protein